MSSSFWHRPLLRPWASLVVKNPHAKQEMQVPSLGQEDPLEKEIATIPVFLPGKSHGKRSLGCKRIGHNLFLATIQQQQSMLNMDEQSPLQNADAGRTKLQSNPSAHTLL